MKSKKEDIFHSSGSARSQWSNLGAASVRLTPLGVPSKKIANLSKVITAPLLVAVLTPPHEPKPTLRPLHPSSPNTTTPGSRPTPTLAPP